MISVKLLAKTVEKFTVDNAPIILTGAGVAGTLASVFLTFKATVNATRMVEEERHRIYVEVPSPVNDELDDIVLSKGDTFKLVWKEYIPVAGTVAVTVACIICAHRVSTKRIAAMAAAYSLSEKAYGEYREKVLEKFNANKERQVRDEIAQDHVTKNPPNDAQIIITGNGDVICYDQPTGRYFKSNMEKLRSVQNDINAQVNETGVATLSDFYVALNLKETPWSEEIGWTTAKLLDIHFAAVLTDDNQPCIAIDYHPVNIRTGAGFPRGCDEEPPF